MVDSISMKKKYIFFTIIIRVFIFNIKNYKIFLFSNEDLSNNELIVNDNNHFYLL